MKNRRTLLMIVVLCVVSNTAIPAESPQHAGLFPVDSSMVTSPAADSRRALALEEVAARRAGVHRLAQEENPEATKTAVTDIVLASTRFYNRLAYDSTYYVMAKVRNTGTSTPCFTKIYMEFESASGTVLMSDWTYITGSNRTLVSIDSETDTCLVPGETGFFGTYVTGPMNQVDRVDYRFEYDVTNTTVPDANIVVSSGPNPLTSGGDIKLTGELKNTGRSDARFVQIHACLEGTSDRLLDVDMTYVDGVTIGGSDSGLRRNQSGPFTMYTNADASSYRRTETKTAWDDYGSVASCTYTISPTSRSVGSNGETGTVQVTTQSACAWQARSNVNWVTLASGTSGTGSGTVRYAVGQNTGSSNRVGTVTIAGKTFTVNQAGSAACSYQIDPTSSNRSARAGTGEISVTTSSSCSWQARSNKSWIHIVGDSSGTGSGTVRYSIDENTGTSDRTGTMTIAGRTFTVNQNGASGSSITYYVGGIARAPGIGGSSWRSSVTLYNVGDAIAHVDLTYRYATAQRTAEVSLSPGAVRCWLDVVHDLFAVAGSSSGYLEIASDRPLVITPRTYNDSGEGTFGQLMPVSTLDDAFENGATVVIGEVRRNSSFRTNIGFVNISGSTCEASFHLVNAIGAPVGSDVVITIPARTAAQQNNVVDVAGLSAIDLATATVEIKRSGCRILVFGSMIDNRTGDPTTLPASVQ